MSSPSKTSATGPPTTRSILGPLTTTFTVPESCTSLGAFGTGPSAQSFYLGVGCSNSSVTDATTCWPPPTTSLKPTVLNNDNKLNGLGAYSPGLYCPSGYVTACAQQKDAQGNDKPPTSTTSYSFQFPITSSETAIGCCPTYVCSNLRVRNCTR